MISRWYHRTLALILAVAGTSAAPAWLAAQEPVSADALGRDTPRGAVSGFLAAAHNGHFDRAAEYLDLTATEDRGGNGPAPGPQLAQTLAQILQHRLIIDPDQLSADPAGDTGDGLPPDRERIGRIDSRHGAVDVILERTTADSGVGLWRFSRLTLRRMDLLADDIGNTPLRSVMPEAFFEISAFGFSLAQMSGLLAVLLLSLLSSFVLSRLGRRLARPLVALTPTPLDDRLMAALRGPLELASASILVALGARWLEFSAVIGHGFSVFARAAVTGAVGWFLWRALDAIAQAVEQLLVSRGHSIATSILPLGKRTAQVFVVAFAVLFMLQNAGYNVTGILAGLGVGGLAIALAAQKTLENYFGGVSLVIDRPVEIGQECRFGDRTGVVEFIGLRSTRIRTAERSLISIPNAAFALLQIENLAERDRRLVLTRLALAEGSDAEQVRQVLLAARELLERTPQTVATSRRVNLVGILPGTIEIEVSVLIETREQERFLALREEILLGLLEIAGRAGARLASAVPAAQAGPISSPHTR